MTTTRPTRAQGREVNHKPHAELSGILQGGRSVAEFGTVRRKQSGVWIRIEERSKECSRVERAWDRERRGERENTREESRSENEREKERKERKTVLMRGEKEKKEVRV
jgi:hypothetical protein